MGGSSTVLQKNDNLIGNKIRSELIQSTPFRNIVDQYYDRIREKRLSTPQRVKHVTRVLKKLWVISQKEETFKIIENFRTYEELLFRLEDYRGHFIHQFNVFLLGYYILNKLLEKDSSVKEILRQTNTPNLTWMLSATFHDVGYPLEQIDNWFSDFLQVFLRVEAPYKIEIERILTPLFFEYITYISQTHYGLRSGTRPSLGRSSFRDWKFHNVLLGKMRKKDHGVMSALLLMHSLLTQEELAHNQGWLLGTLPVDIMPACHAIAVHSFDPEDIKINLRQYPYAFLLVLCDELQDWGRSIEHKDYSELTELELNCQKQIPSITCTLRINNPNKIDALDNLKRKLDSDNLIHVTVKQENHNKQWEI